MRKATLRLPTALGIPDGSPDALLKLGEGFAQDELFAAMFPGHDTGGETRWDDIGEYINFIDVADPSMLVATLFPNLKTGQLTERQIAIALKYISGEFMVIFKPVNGSLAYQPPSNCHD